MIAKCYQPISTILWSRCCWGTVCWLALRPTWSWCWQHWQPKRNQSPSNHMRAWPLSVLQGRHIEFDSKVGNASRLPCIFAFRNSNKSQKKRWWKCKRASVPEMGEKQFHIKFCSMFLSCCLDTVCTRQSSYFCQLQHKPKMTKNSCLAEPTRLVRVVTNRTHHLRRHAAMCRTLPNNQDWSISPKIARSNWTAHTGLHTTSERRQDSWVPLTSYKFNIPPEMISDESLEFIYLSSNLWVESYCPRNRVIQHQYSRSTVSGNMT